MLLKFSSIIHTKGLAKITVGVDKIVLYFSLPGYIESIYFPALLEVRLVIWPVGCKQKQWVSLLGWRYENPWVTFQLSFSPMEFDTGRHLLRWWIKNIQANWILESLLRCCPRQALNSQTLLEWKMMSYLLSYWNSEVCLLLRHRQVFWSTKGVIFTFAMHSEEGIQV